ncbi:NTP transferase domain-containing protein [Flavimarina sp. Hel_I_48]|uniref:NTP transferase domain-containing protein n=1 Tax=Flavimarina sp. Hel_I_48 TaxID=1392488 RepID=UPI00068C2608|nr:NTP transferase domain-containing protein [Flavimarina sp. Hel_I_48]
MDSEELRGLVLAGGKSERMGVDKANICYHQLPQQFHTASQLEDLGIKAFISIRKEQAQKADYKYIVDLHKNMGPMTGLLSAFETYECSWLCMGCDYPMISKVHIQKLLKERDKTVFATVFQDKNTGFLIPTLAIYECSFFLLLKENVLKKQFSLQKILKNNPCHIIPVDGDAYTSADTKNDYERITRKLGFSEGNREGQSE